MGELRIAIWVPPHLTQDRLFEMARDDCLAPFRELRSAIADANGSCHTHDWFKTNNVLPDIVIFMDIPPSRLSMVMGNWWQKVSPWVILQEPAIIIPHNYDSLLHKQFERIFTWNDDLVDGVLYIKFNYGHRFPDGLANSQRYEARKLAVMIAGNKKSQHPLELYSEREKAIRWFEEHHPGEFDLYGFGWDRYLFNGNRLVRKLNLIKWLTRILASPYPSWKGVVAVKNDVLKEYRFAICYENARDIKGYITEKIFDCFFAGCVPVYWGAPNISEYIPSDCFIDRRDFSGYAELYEFMSGMDDDTFHGYQRRIMEFLSSPAAYPFTAECFARTIVSGMLDG